MKTINATSYYKATKANFQHIPAIIEMTKPNGEKISVDCPENLWAELREKYADQIKNSPISDSQYIVLHDRVYRMADHWGRCASCYWELEGAEDFAYPENFRWGSWSIGVAHFSQFELAK